MDENTNRQTSGVTTSLLLRYVRSHGGDRAVAELLADAGLSHDGASLEAGTSWVSYETRDRLFAAAARVTGDPRVMFRVGAEAVDHLVHHSIVVLMRALGSPRHVYRYGHRLVAKFSTTTELEVVEVGRNTAVLRTRVTDGIGRSSYDCDYTAGLFSAAPRFFGLPAATVEHRTCEAHGAEYCEYSIHWKPRRIGRSRGGADVENRALRGQLEALQLAASDLAGTDDVDQVLQTIVERAISAVLAPAYLLVLGGTGDRPVTVRANGLPQARAEELARTLLDEGTLGANALVVDVASSRQVHGRLAVLYAPGHVASEGDRGLVEAYAGHAAAALDLVTALEASRGEERRATALLTLAHELATAGDTAAVAAVAAAAIPRIVGCRSAGVWVWEPGDGVLRLGATEGHTDEEATRLRGVELRPDQTPELADLLARQEAVVLYADEVSAELGAVLTAVGSLSLIVVPLLAGPDLMGAAIASWDRRREPTAEDPEVLARIVGVSDQTATALQNARLLTTVRHQSLHDALTGLPNRVLFAKTLDATLRAAGPSCATAVLFCDLDRFKHVNDEYGHAAGDELLRQAAARLRGVLRPGDAVGRLSGDEFAALLVDVDEQAAVAVATRVVDALAQPYRLDGREVRITASVGVALHTGTDGRGDRLLAAADSAMYAAKQHGRNQVSVAGEVPGRHGVPSLEAELARAVDARQLRLFFQPVVDVAAGSAGSVVGAEALLRWAHPRLGLLPPGAFLPLAEEAGLVPELDIWAVGAAVEALARWPEPASGPLRIAVNLASATLVDPRLVPAVRSALNTHGIPADRLHLEVVESRSLADLPGVTERLAELRQMGVRISLDDFGTGYSTLAWLQTLPVDQIKIDRSFTARLGTDDASLAVVRGVMALARELGIEVIAEGVEIAQQLHLLRDAGCGMVQGYLLGRPGPVLDTGAPLDALAGAFALPAS